jgi:protein O-GlcNAc transferase
VNRRQSREAPAETALGEALSHHRAGRLAEAKRLYGEALAAAPDSVDALHLLGVIECQAGNSERAADLIGKAVVLRPGFADAHSNLSVALKDLGRIDEAVAACHKALAINPDFAEAYSNLGRALKELGRLDEAVAAQQQAIALQPTSAEAHNNLGVALHGLGRLAEAAAAFHGAVTLKPTYGDAYYNLANALRAQGQLDEAVAAYQGAVAVAPDHGDAHNTLGTVLQEQGQLGQAVAAYRHAMVLRPGDPKVVNNLGIAYQEMGRPSEAMAAFRQALAVQPDLAATLSNLILAMNYDNTVNQGDILAESRRWDDAHGVVPVTCNKPRDPEGRLRIGPEGRLRIGYVSPDFRRHSVGHFIEPIIAHHDRWSFEVYCYAEVASPDDHTAHFQGLANHWRSTLGLSDSAVADQIREDRIDVLVDLAGHTAGNRLGVFARQPAPVQIAWIGYPNTTGMATMGYRFTDAVADPPGPADQDHTETLLRLDNGFLCFAPPVDAPDVAPLPSLANGHVTFGSFNHLPKVNPAVVVAWATILKRVPGSRLVIKSRTLADPETRERYDDLFTAEGIEPGRIELVSWVPSTAGHLGAYGRVDIALDPFPYNGTTTTCEALWMGVPVVTLRGDRHAGRVGASLLTRVGLGELIAETGDTYIDTAVALAGAPEQLANLRHTLRQRMADSTLCDPETITRDVEAAYRRLAP